MPCSYSVSMWCGCRVYVSCHPQTRLANARIIERRGDACPDRRHHVGVRLWLWELLPDRRVDNPAILYEGL